MGFLPPDKLPPLDDIADVVVVMGLILLGVSYTVGITIVVSWALGFYG